LALPEVFNRLRLRINDASKGALVPLARREKTMPP